MVKSGGKTRRAAKMNTIRDWHGDVEEFITSIAGLGNVTIQFTAIPRLFTAATVCVANGGELKLIGKAGTLSEALAMLNESIARASQAHGQG